MWNENDGYRNTEEEREGGVHDERQPRSSTSSEVVMIDERVMAAASRSTPAVSNLNISKSSRVHIGPKFVSVTQNVNNSEMVKELPLPLYLWNIIKNTTRAERLSCAAALLALLICTSLIVYFTVVAKSGTVDVVDKAPHEWNITRDMWLAQPANMTYTDKFEPLKLVIVQHSVSPECHRFIACAAELRNLQAYYLKKHFYDLPYNFIIGNDGRVYEGRGWGVEGAHTKGFNRCSVGIGFIGDYREEYNVHTRVTDKQMEHTKMLLEEGVRRGHLSPDYRIVGAKDLQSTESPGSNLYNAIRKWTNYDHENRFYNKTCEQIHGMSISTTTAAAY